MNQHLMDTQQLFLFEREDKLDEKVKILVKHLYRTGRYHQYIDVYIRQREHLIPELFSLVLNTLKSIESSAEWLCMSLGEISSLKALKTPNPDFSKLFNSQLQIESKDDFSKEELLSRVRQLKNRYFELSIMIDSMINSREIKDYDVSEGLIRHCMKVLTAINLLLNNISESHDI